MLMGVSDTEKERYTHIVDELGGAVSDTVSFDPLTTHVITVRPSRSERHLAAIASGKWLLFSTFLEESQKQGRFVEVSVYVARLY